MVKKLLTVFMLGAAALSANAQLQATNGDFETWTYDGVNLPNNWNSFQTFEYTSALTKQGYSSSNRQVKQSKEVRPGTSGQYSCVIWCRSIIGVPAQGNLTTGRIHAGSTKAADVSNYNYADIDNSTTNNGVENPFAMQFTGRPDSVVFWAKFVPKKDIADYPYAKFSAIIHDAYNYIAYGLDSNDTLENKSHVVAKAVSNISKNNGAWQRISVPFEYTTNDINAEYIMINASTNAYPGKGNAGDSLYIDDIEMVYNTPYVEPLYVTVNNVTNAPQDAAVTVTKYKDTFNFTLKNFILASDEVFMPVGNINVDGLTADAEGKFSFDGDIWLTEGDDPEIEEWMGPLLCMDDEGNPAPMHIIMNGQFVDDKVYVDIDIDMMDILGQFIKVHLGDDYVGANMAVNADAKYGTFCAPFDVTIPDGVTASKATLDGKQVVLTDLDVIIPANTPVILNAEDGLDAVTVYGKPVADTPTKGCLTGVYEATTINSGYVLQNQEGVVGFYEVKSSKVVPANRAYINAPAGARVLTFGDETAISNINMNANANAAIYNIAGQRVSKAEKGIFIINGKKVVK